MYASLSTRHYRSNSSENGPGGEEMMSLDDLSMEQMCPNIHITRPEDYEAKKVKSTNSTTAAPRIRNMTAQEKKNKNVTASKEVPKTDPKNFIIRFNPLDPVNKRRKSTDPQRPPPKAGKRRNPVEPGSSTAEDDDEDSAVDVGSYSDDTHTSKKRKSTTTSSIDTITASPYALSYPTESYNNLTRPSDLIGTIPTLPEQQQQQQQQQQDFWMYDKDPNQMLLTSEYPMLFDVDVDAQNILEGLQVPQQVVSQHPDMKTIDLQSFSLEKNLHFSSNTFTTETFSDPNSNWYVPDLTSYNLDQYVDFEGATSDLLMEDDPTTTTMNTYWPADANNCYFNMPFNTSSKYE